MARSNLMLPVTVVLCAPKTSPKRTASSWAMAPTACGAQRRSSGRRHRYPAREPEVMRPLTTTTGTPLDAQAMSRPGQISVSRSTTTLGRAWSRIRPMICGRSKGSMRVCRSGESTLLSTSSPWLVQDVASTGTPWRCSSRLAASPHSPAEAPESRCRKGGSCRARGVLLSPGASSARERPAARPRTTAGCRGCRRAGL